MLQKESLDKKVLDLIWKTIKKLPVILYVLQHGNYLKFLNSFYESII